jgi:hypothetical protein
VPRFTLRIKRARGEDEPELLIEVPMPQRDRRKVDCIAAAFQDALNRLVTTT